MTPSHRGGHWRSAFNSELTRQHKSQLCFNHIRRFIRQLVGPDAVAIVVNLAGAMDNATTGNWKMTDLPNFTQPSLAVCDKD